jgi:hypothetical protein
VHHNIVPVMLLHGVHTACGCSGAVNHGYNVKLCIILTCSWCVANLGFENRDQPPEGTGAVRRNRDEPRAQRIALEFEKQVYKTVRGVCVSVCPCSCSWI